MEHAPKRELPDEESRKKGALSQAEAQAREHADAEQALRRREQHFADLAFVERQGRDVAGTDGVGDRQTSHEQRPLIDLRREQDCERGTRLAAHGEERRHEELRCFAGEGRQPLHEEKLVDAEAAASCHQALGERLG